jgi:hypothetical protein
MYLEYKDKIATDHRGSFPRLWIVGENILHLSAWFLAGWLVWPIQWHGFPVAVVVWSTVVVLVQVLLKKHNCSGCYYYGKSCHLGWGMLSARLFEKDSGNIETGKRLSLFYVLSPPVILLAAILEGILLDVETLHWVLLGLYILLNVISFPVRMRGCRVCAIRNACPGSACKTSCGK